MPPEDIDEDESTGVAIQFSSKPIHVEFQNICYKRAVPKHSNSRQYVLKNVSGSFNSSRLTIVVGPTGSGKTTLLKLLADSKLAHTASNIKFNGRTFDTNTIRRKSTYITYDMPLLEHLTVFETLKFASDFKLSSNYGTIRKLKLIQSIITNLNLTDIRNTLIAKLDESQRCILSLAVGLITKSSILYFDIAARAFDDQSLMAVLNYLKMTVAPGRTVICAIDQPTTKMLQLFDDLLVLSNGQSIYCGAYDKIDNVLARAGFMRPPCLGHAEYILDIASQVEINENYQQLMQSTDPIKFGDQNDVANSILNVSKSKQHEWRYPVSYWQQFILLVKRNVLCMVRDRLHVQLRLASHIVVGLFIGMVFYDIGNSADKMYTNASLLYFMLLYIFFANVIPAILSFSGDVQVFLHDHKNRYYACEIYLMAKFFTESIQQAIGPTVFLVIVFFMTNQPTASFVFIWPICVLVGLIAQGKALLFASVVRNSTLQLYTILFTCIPVLIFSGGFIKFNELPDYLYPFIYISYFRYGFEGSMQSIYGFDRPNLICSGAFCYFKVPEKYLEAVFMGGQMYFIDVAGLVAWILLLFSVIYIVFKWRVRHPK